MTADDVLAYMAEKPKKDRAFELRSDAVMLKVWLVLRNDIDFDRDVIRRHGLDRAKSIDMNDPHHQHAISNAWGHAVQVRMPISWSKP